MKLQDFANGKCWYNKAEDNENMLLVCLESVNDVTLFVELADWENVKEIECWVDTQHFGSVKIIYPYLESDAITNFEKINDWFYQIIRNLRYSDSMIDDVPERAELINYLMTVMEGEVWMCDDIHIDTTYGKIKLLRDPCAHWSIEGRHFDTLKEAVDYLKKEKIRRDGYDPLFPHIV